jgi:glucosamine-6-phosphate deaminase
MRDDVKELSYPDSGLTVWRCDTAKAVDMAAADIAEEVIRSEPAGKPGPVLGLATGSTPEGMYAELVRRHREKGLSFANVTTFNLDEYVGLYPGHDQSYRHFMVHQLFMHVDVKYENTFLPSGLEWNMEKHVQEYEELIKAKGGIDLQVLGIGSNGHIGFNEPGSTRESRTRVVELDEQTRRDNSRFFGNDVSKVPTHAISMGVGTVLEAKKIILMAKGEGKADAIARSVKGRPTPEVPASLLQRHPDCTFILDPGAASRLE